MVLMSNYIVTSVDPGKNIGGGKAKEDIIKYLGEIGYTSLPLRTHKTKFEKLLYGKFKLPQKVKKLDLETVILQYPVSSRYALASFLSVLKRYPAQKFVIWVHDIQSLQSENETEIQNELDLFDQADELIVHNPQMKRWLLEHGYTKPMHELSIFDYDNPQPFQTSMNYNGSLCFAGNLFKSEFLQKMELKSTVNVFGPNMFTQAPDCIEYEGQYSPEELPKYLTQNFGLIWDGQSTESCTGTFGRYLLYNNPHKTSLYISSGLPIIIWEKAALADFITNNGIGLTISDLNKLDDVLQKVTPEEYAMMRKKTIAMGEKLRQGYFTKKVVASLQTVSRKE